MFGRLRDQPKIVVGALALVLLVLAGFSVGGAMQTQSAAASATAASKLYDASSSAKGAVASMESLERKYRLEPSEEVLQRYQKSVDDLRNSLERVARLGGSAEVAMVADVSSQEGAYLAAIDRLFAAVDSGDTAAVLRIDSEEVDPTFDGIVEVVEASSEKNHAAALATLADLSQTERTVFALTAAAFIAGLAILGLLLRTMTGHLRRMWWLAQHDSVTGLGNRVQFLDRVEKALADGDEEGRSVAVMLLDLDRFKDVNDTLGHHVGDQLLRLIGPRLRTVLRETDVIARLGGDEFGILPGRRASADDSTEQIATRLTKALREPFVVDGLTLQMEGSIGVAVAPQHGTDAASLLQRADVAMYAAKGSGVDFRVYDASFDDNTPRRLALLSQLRSAIESEQMVLHYQPKIRMADGTVTGVEALVRWQHPDEGLIGPSDFIPLAESSGIIHELTRYVIARAAHQASEWMALGYRVPVAVNLSARCLLDLSLPEAVREVIRRAGIEPGLLTLEVTETAAMIDPQRAASILRRLAALGVHLSIDDFGTGYTSMAYLSELPMHELKIDQSFVRRMLTDPKANAVVRTSIDLAARMGMTVVAEGVEDVATKQALDAQGCDQAQGFLFARPASGDSVTAYLAHHATATAS